MRKEGSVHPVSGYHIASPIKARGQIPNKTGIQERIWRLTLTNCKSNSIEEAALFQQMVLVQMNLQNSAIQSVSHHINIINMIL